VAHVPSGNGAFLIIAEAGVDHDAAVAGFNNQGVNTHDQPPIRFREMRGQPVDFLNGFAGCVRQDELRPAGDLQLDNPRDFNVADLPSVHEYSPGFNPNAWLCPLDQLTDYGLI